ncbi:MAG: ATP-binding cassette domain-containing protein [Anaerolinea sp.]|nr:ATP-binding cassette domain-containing protein [Anaerolinea sp.]
MIEVQGLRFGYAGAAPLFTDFNWQVQRGERWAVFGSSGCGKTTLLYLLAGLHRPQAGQVRIAGQPLQRPRPHTGLILQDYGLLPWATVRQNASLGLRVRDFYGPDGKHAPADFRPTQQDVTPWLERLGLLPVAEQYPAQLSGGQRQRTAIARTLALQPDLLLMDEPFSSLDAVTREALQDLTCELCQEQSLTLVLVTHAIEEAVRMGEHILLLGQPPNSNAVCFENPFASCHVAADEMGRTALIQQLRQELNRR